MKSWLYRLQKDYTCELSEYLSQDDFNDFKIEVIREIHFYSGIGKNRELRLCITPDGKLTVFEGYAWDGNSPKFNFLGLFWIGTPDGLLYENKTPTHEASLVHDALGQFKTDSRMPSIFRAESDFEGWCSKGRKGRDRIHFELLKKADFYPRHLYYVLLSAVGPIHDALENIRKNDKLEGKGKYAIATATAIVIALVWGRDLAGIMHEVSTTCSDGKCLSFLSSVTFPRQ